MEKVGLTGIVLTFFIGLSSALGQRPGKQIGQYFWIWDFGLPKDEELSNIFIKDGVQPQVRNWNNKLVNISDFEKTVKKTKMSHFTHVCLQSSLRSDTGSFWSLNGNCENKFNTKECECWHSF